MNRGVVGSLAENEPLTEGKLAAVGSGAGLPPTITEGMRAVSIRVNEIIGVAGFVIPGTRVDVLVTVSGGQEGQVKDEAQTRVVLSNVQVLTAGTRYDQERATKDGKPITTSVVTLLLTPQDAEKLTLASDEGPIMLTLRNPLDIAPTDTEGARFSELLGKGRRAAGQAERGRPDGRPRRPETARRRRRRRSTPSRPFARRSALKRRSVELPGNTCVRLESDGRSPGVAAPRGAATCRHAVERAAAAAARRPLPAPNTRRSRSPPAGRRS